MKVIAMLFLVAISALAQNPARSVRRKAAATCQQVKKLPEGFKDTNPAVVIMVPHKTSSKGRMAASMGQASLAERVAAVLRKAECGDVRTFDADIYYPNVKAPPGGLVIWSGYTARSKAAANELQQVLAQSFPVTIFNVNGPEPAGGHYEGIAVAVGAPIAVKKPAARAAKGVIKR